MVTMAASVPRTGRGTCRYQTGIAEVTSGMAGLGSAGQGARQWTAVRNKHLDELGRVRDVDHGSNWFNHGTFREGR